REEFRADCRRLLLERRAQGVVPTVQEAEGRDHRDDLDDLRLAPMLAHLGKHLVGDAVWHRRGGDGEVERDALGFAEEATRAEIPDGGELLLLDAEMQRAAGGVRHAVAAAGSAARDMRDEAFEAALHLASGFPNCRGELRERPGDLRFALTAAQRVRA